MNYHKTSLFSAGVNENQSVRTEIARGIRKSTPEHSKNTKNAKCYIYESNRKNNKTSSKDFIKLTGVR